MILNPADVVRETEQLLGHVVGKLVRLESSIDGAAPWVSADPVQLNQVLLNLAVNARDAMPDGGTLALRVDEWSAEHELEDRPGVLPGRYCRSRSPIPAPAWTRRRRRGSSSRSSARSPSARARGSASRRVRHRQAERWPHLRGVPARPRHDVRDPAPGGRGRQRSALPDRGLSGS